MRSLRELQDARLLAWAATIGIAILLAFGTISAIIPNPVFARSIPPEPFAIVVWLVSAPLAGLIAATYVVAPSLNDAPPLVVNAISPADVVATQRTADGTTLASLGGFAAFLAIGCPLCNKVALVMLGTGGALSVFAPIQPVIGAASVVLLGITLAWRLRLRVDGASCSRPVQAP
ncbi:MAG: hypothetical protein ACXWXA_06740 [Candidatus Limnocylindrales bacterium]